MTDLEGIASYFDWWLQHQERECAREGLQTDDDTMIVNPPKWPDRRQLKAIIGAAQDAQKRIAELEVENTRLRAALRRCNDAATEAGNDTRHTRYEREVARGIGAIIRKEMAGLGME